MTFTGYNGFNWKFVSKPHAAFSITEYNTTQLSHDISTLNIWELDIQ
jgi:hypothetical protein